MTIGSKELALAAILTISLPALQGCVPLVVVGAGAGIMMADDRRTAGTYVDDQGTELKAASSIREANLGDGVRVDITSFNYKVLLTGEVPNEEIKRKVGETVRGVEKVREVVNELVIAGVSSLTARSDDSLLTGKVKARMVDSDAPVNHVKVVTSKGVVYLMGLVTRKEGELAAESAATTSGVQKVVKVFEYTD
jgi:osmotically-inducible protein OsmY